MKKLEWGRQYYIVREKLELLFRKFSIYKRLITVMLLVSIAPIVMIGSISIHIIYGSIRSNYVNHIESTNEILADNLSLFIQDVESFGTQLLFSSTIRQGLQKSEGMTLNEQVQFIREVEQIISQNYSLLTLAADISILNVNKDFLYAQGYRYVNTDFMINCIEELEESGKSSLKKSFYSRDGRYIGIILKITNGNPHTPMGYLFIAIDEIRMQNILEKGMISGVGGLMLLDLEGDVVTSIGQPTHFDLDEFLKQCYLKGDYKGTKMFTYNLVSYKYVSYNDWYLISSTPNTYILSEVLKVVKSLLIGIIVLIVIVTLISFLLWQSIIRPLNRLIMTMKSINTIELTDPQREDGNDEMTYLYKEFNIMIQFIKDLISDMNETNESQRRLELKMLQAQINPHFLFNTLNSIKWMAEMSNVKTISNTIGALSRLLQATISDTNELIPISQELQNVEDYMTIQRNRYGDTFHFTVDIEVDCLDYKITRFILQPIVENSLLHGLNEEEDLKITIKVRDMLNWIYLYVEDNGAGFDVEKVLEKKSKEKLDGKLSSIGMINVIERINLCYQSEGDIKILSRLNEGTTVVIKIPKQL
ncbi:MULTISPECIES: sensor histidine kinase [Turicibacter]|uniref:HAMP domain-containing protein n=4 Tax=Turicibacter sanguinis TaxID=154288 RepID=A0A9X4XDQ4_9FIRM|nr:MULTISPECIES: histidine kinase [Turicibacter]EFF64841.1 HAMP domain protein [Turicibacter sanguinis PC909]EGC92407.1 HAMP domain protein [Turicibacter sp. HGF1]MBP3904503.1 histidine kinase [Turicibacter sp.]MCU7190337.1 histidine kinase [Turicibacter sanguinis]MCU7197339.1 histidine kinase [Turicibacter sanguinis]